MAHYRKKRPSKTIGNKCMLCQMRLIIGNSKKMWGSEFHYCPTKHERKHVDLTKEGWVDA